MGTIDLAQQVDEIGIDRALCDKGFRHFIPLAWHQICPSTPFTPGWHIDAIADHLEACFKREIHSLVINVPPGSTKSLTACVAFPTWCWTQDAVYPNYGPSERFIYGTYDEKLAKRDSVASRNLIGSKWYQNRWGDRVAFDMDQEFTGDIYYNKSGGSRKMATVGGSVVGFHASMQFTDDPIKPLEVSGSLQVAKTALAKASEWWNGTMSVRVMDYNRLVRVIIMQRLHHADLAGEMLKTGDYVHLMLPMECEIKRKCFIEVTGFEDPRKEEGELLCEDRWDAAAVQRAKNELGPRAAQAQFQQNPTPLEGAVFRRDKVQYYTELPEGKGRQIQSWDCNFRETQDGSFVCGQVWLKNGANYYLLDQYRKRVEFSETCDALIKMSARWPKAMKKIIEGKANGDAVYSHLKNTLPGMKKIDPQGGKESRANAVEPLWEGGNIYFPHPTIAPWIVETVEEICSFPAYPTDDCVDAMSQAIVEMQGGSFALLKAAMKNVRR